MRARLATKVLNAAADGRTVNRRTLARAEKRLGWCALRLPRVVEQVGVVVRGAIEASSALVEAVAACAEAMAGMAELWRSVAREATRQRFATGGIAPRDGAHQLADRDAWHLRPTGSETTAEPGSHSTNALAYLITTPQRGRWLGFRRFDPCQ